MLTEAVNLLIQHVDMKSEHLIGFRKFTKNDYVGFD